VVTKILEEPAAFVFRVGMFCSTVSAVLINFKEEIYICIKFNMKTNEECGIAKNASGNFMLVMYWELVLTN
jgi:hypothetical protein